MCAHDVKLRALAPALSLGAHMPHARTPFRVSSVHASSRPCMQALEKAVRIAIDKHSQALDARVSKVERQLNDIINLGNKVPFVAFGGPTRICHVLERP